MRKSHYPEYFGGKHCSRGPQTFRYWCHMLGEYSAKLSKRRKRFLLSSWLEEDASTR